ncbi:MAG: preprotein translocase subunit YajC [Clostridiales bacterium]|nr:preprotein translocase subunit YajC [Clostridiales bacterium]
MGDTGGLIYLAVLVAAFYLLIIRPQMRNAKRVRELLASLEVGDRIVTVGGMRATITALNDETVTLEVADGVTLFFDRGAVGRKLDPDLTQADEGSTSE